MAPQAASLLEERAVVGGYRNSAGGAGSGGAHQISVFDKDRGAGALDREPGEGGALSSPSHGESTEDAPEDMAMERQRSTVEFDAADELEVPMVDRLPFNAFVAAATLLNALVLGLEQDLGPKNVPFSERMSWYALECLFSLCFAVEMVLRISSAAADFLDWISDLWNAFDLLLVLAALVDAFALTPLGAPAGLRLLTALRALRVVRLVRLLRTLPAFRELWLLVGGLANSMKALGWVALIALVALYVGGIVATTEIGQNREVYGVGPSYDGEPWPYEKYFGDVPTSMFSLFQAPSCESWLRFKPAHPALPAPPRRATRISGDGDLRLRGTEVMTMDGWCDDIVRHVVHRQPLMGLFFVVFLFVMAFGLINVVIGIIVENTLAAAQVADRRTQDEEGRTRRHAVEALTDLLVRSDSRRTGEISIAELQVAYESAIVQDLFKKIGLTMQEAKNIFTLLDYERRGRVELKRFANSCRELVGGAKRRDIAQVEITVGTLARHLEQLDVQFHKIEAEVGNINAMTDSFVEKTVRTLTGFNGSHKQHIQTHGSLSQ